MSFFFNGRLWVSPATMSMIDDSAMFNRGLSVGNVLAIVGRADGGEPFKPLRFGSTDQARAVLRSGETLKAIEKAFAPSAQTGGPAEVMFIRVNPATTASLTLKNSADQGVIELISEAWGKPANAFKIKIETGSKQGKKVTTQSGNAYYAGDNLARNCLSVSYNGAAEVATVSVTSNAVTLVADAVSTEIDLADFETVQSLADRISAVPGFDAVVQDGNGEAPTVNGLDHVSAASVKTAPFVVTGHLQAVVDWINSQAEGFVTARRLDNAGTLPANMPFTYLSGGTDGEVTMTEWQRAFDVLQNEDVQWVVPISPMPAIHAMVEAHCSFMSTVGRMERRTICGTALGTSDEDAIEAAKQLNSDRASLCHLGMYDYNDKGKLTLYPPYVLAAQIAGAFAGSNPGTALTNKTLSLRGLERKLRNPTDTDQLINGGVLCVEDTAKGYKVVQSITTWLVNDNYNRVEVSCGVALDFTVRNVRDVLDDLRGAKGTPITMSDAISRADTRLAELSRPEPMGPGVLAGDAENPAYRGLTASIEGDVMRIEFECSPVIPINYIPVVVYAQPYAGSASA